MRGIGYTWDNPDFAIIDPDTGFAVDNHHLQGGKRYKVHATIHNSSIMAALDTKVTCEVLHFGAGTTVTQGLGSVSVDVPALGSTLATVDWTTPPTAGHNCLRAMIAHPDDANPLNNIGQHNTDVATPASPTRTLKFRVGNHAEHERAYVLTMNSHRLPETPLVPGGGERETGRGQSVGRGNPPRRSLEYLKLLQDRNDFAKFPVPGFLQARLGHERLVLRPGEEIETFVEMNPPHAGQGRQVVNVNVMHDGTLVGGVTAYVEEE